MPLRPRGVFALQLLFSIDFQDQGAPEPAVPVSRLPGYNAWIQRINRGRVPEAVKVAGRWYIPARLLELEAS
jgi:hypothetical protein